MNIKLNDPEFYYSEKANLGNNLKICTPVRLYGSVKIGDNVEIGKYTYIGNGTNISANTIIGDYCSISRNIEIGPVNHPLNMLSTHPFQYNEKHFPSSEYKLHKRVQYKSKKHSVIIGNDVWIGAQSIIMRGVTIGDGAVIAGGSVVTKDVPPYAIYGGVPAKLIKFRFSTDIIQELLKLKWWELRPLQLNGVDFENINVAIIQIKSIKKTLSLQNNLRNKELVNNGGGSRNGILWLKTPSPIIDKSIFPINGTVEIKDVKNSKFGNHDTTLKTGKYLISKVTYDKVNERYGIKLKSLAGIDVIEVVGKSSAKFVVV